MMNNINDIKVTSTRVRMLNNNNLLAVASITLNEQLIINDIKVYFTDGVISIKLPNTEYAKNNNQFSVIPKSPLFSEIKSSIIQEINKQTSDSVDKLSTLSAI